jgi:hypothetical protein
LITINSIIDDIEQIATPNLKKVQERPLPMTDRKLRLDTNDILFIDENKVRQEDPKNILSENTIHYEYNPELYLSSNLNVNALFATVSRYEKLMMG